MRNPRRKACYWLALGTAGALLVLAGANGGDWLGAIPSLVMVSVGITAAAVGLVYFLISLFSAMGHARLLAGRGEIARWHITAQEWDRFRAFDAIRAAQDPTLSNDLRIRELTPTQGVDVIVGRKQLIVDGSYHVLRPYGLPELRAVWWLPAPADPECLEFAVAYPRGRYGTVQVSLRVPVSPAARDAGLRAFEHFRALIPEGGRGLAQRRPRLVMALSLATGVAAAAAAGIGWMLYTRGDRSAMPMVLLVVGITTAVCALLFAALVKLLRGRPPARPS